jgi:ABC-type Fe3+-siderophore transport system permease subunit
MYAASKTPVQKDVLVNTIIAMLVLTSVAILSRAALQFSKRNPLEFPDILIYSAYVSFIGLWSCYFTVIPPIYRAYAVLDGESEVYPTMMQDAVAMLRFLVSGQICFYTLLLAVKLSLMTWYRKLLAGLSGKYTKIWWGVVAFIILVST